MKRKWLWGVVIAVLAIVATIAKHGLNEFGVGFYRQYNRPNLTMAYAKEEGTFIAEFQIEPLTLRADDKEFTFSEAWLEMNYEPTHSWIWFSQKKRTNWSFLCVRAKPHSYQEGFSFNLNLEFPQPFEIKDPVKIGEVLTGVGDDLCVQKVPTDLQEVIISVRTETNVKLGSSRLRRIP